MSTVTSPAHSSDPRVGFCVDLGRILVEVHELRVGSEASLQLAHPPRTSPLEGKKKLKTQTSPSSCLIQLQDTPHPAENSPGNAFAF